MPGGQKSTPKGRSKDPLGHTFVNISAMDFDLYLAGGVEMAVVSSGSLSRRSTPVGSVWDNHKDCYSTDTSLSFLSDDILEAVPQTGEECRSPWTTPSEAATVDLLNDSNPWNFDAIADAISSPIESQEDWILSGPETPPSYLSSIPMELVDPELLDALPSSTSSLPAIADSVEDAHRSIPTTTPGHIESSVTQQSCQRAGDWPVAIDAKEGIWEAEALLAKWQQGKTTWFLVKWKGFQHGDNTWEKRKDISLELVEELEATYQGNHLGVRLLEKRVRRGKVEYLVEWKGRPKSENSWQKEATVSRERIMEFEAS